jgi:hypothetical protein
MSVLAPQRLLENKQNRVISRNRRRPSMKCEAGNAWNCVAENTLKSVGVQSAGGMGDAIKGGGRFVVL